MRYPVAIKIVSSFEQLATPQWRLVSRRRVASNRFWSAARPGPSIHHPTPLVFHGSSTPVHHVPRSLKSMRRFNTTSAKRNDHDNYYQVLGIPETFDVDLSKLKQTYHKLMTEYHPDKYHSNNRTDESREDLASAVTRAYDTLKEPHTRAVHLLKVLGRPMDEEGTTETSSGMDREPSKLVGNAFLFEIMEIREEIDQVSSTKSDDQHDRLKALFDSNQERIQATINELIAAFDGKPNDDGASGRNLDEALRLAAELQYWNRIDKTIRDRMHFIG